MRLVDHEVAAVAEPRPLGFVDDYLLLVMGGVQDHGLILSALAVDVYSKAFADR
jgi:hypothetical protein